MPRPEEMMWLAHEIVHQELWAYVGEPFVCEKCGCLVPERPVIDYRGLNVQTFIGPDGSHLPAQ